MLQGAPVELEEMLQCRERRAHIQNTLLNRYHSPILSFTMNIPGPVKVTDTLHRAFKEACALIFDLLAQPPYTIAETLEINEKTGDELMICFTGDAKALKKLTTNLEDTHPLGRLFDIDIIDTDGLKLSRAVYRTCLICDGQAQVCTHSRRHSVEEMQNKIEAMLSNHFMTADQ